MPDDVPTRNEHDELSFAQAQEMSLEAWSRYDERRRGSLAELRSRVRGADTSELARILESVGDEPWNTTTDSFLALPGSVASSQGLALPPAGTYCELVFTADATAPQRILVKQGGTVNPETQLHEGGRVIGRFFGDEDLPTATAHFDSDGDEVFFEFQQFDPGTNKWYPYYNTIEDDSGNAPGGDTRYIMRGAGASFTAEWGPNIQRPPQGYLWVAAKAHCVNALFYSVQTTYGYAFVTATNDPNGLPLSVPELNVRVIYDEFPQGPIANSSRNSSQVEVSEQIRRVPGNCSNIRVRAWGTKPDGSQYQVKQINAGTDGNRVVG